MSLAGYDAATRMERLSAYVFDLMVFGALVVAGVVLSDRREVSMGLGTLFLLLRDALGRSPGKRSVGLWIRDRQGASPDAWRRVARNTPLVIGALTQSLPEPVAVLGGAVGLAEIIAFFVTNRRLGDRLAGTWVVTPKRSPFSV